MLPGLVAGHYTAEEAHIDLCRSRNGRARGSSTTASWDSILTRRPSRWPMATRSRSTSCRSISVHAGHGQSARRTRKCHRGQPAAAFLAAWDKLRAEAAAGKLDTVAVVGGGAGGVELLLAMQHRLHTELGDAAPRFALITDQPQLLPEHAPAVRARFGKLLVARGVVLHLSSGAIAVEPGAVIATHHRRIAVDRVVWVTTAGSQPWPAASGLACDAHGFIQVDNALRSLSHPFVFAAGDCATQIAHPRPKSGVFAVRQGPPLAGNLRRALHNEPPRTYIPQRHALVADLDRRPACDRFARTARLRGRLGVALEGPDRPRVRRQIRAAGRDGAARARRPTRIRMGFMDATTMFPRR